MRSFNFCLTALALTCSLLSGIAHAADFSFGCDLALLNPPIKTPSYGVQIASFGRGTFDIGNLQTETQLRDAGIDVISIDDPSDAEVHAGRSVGYLHAAYEITWAGYVNNIIQHLRIMKTEERATFEERLRRSQNRIQVVTGPLTLGDFRQWHKIYRKEVIERKRSHHEIDKNWAQNLGDLLHQYHKLFLYDENTGKLLGGAILHAEGRYDLHAIFEAYKSEAQDLDLEARAFSEMLTYAAANNFANIFYGRDLNFYGRYLPLSTLGDKTFLGLHTRNLPGTQLLKVLNPNILKRDFLIFALEDAKLAPHHFTDRPRDLKLDRLPTMYLTVHDLRKTPK